MQMQQMQMQQNPPGQWAEGAPSHPGDLAQWMTPETMPSGAQMAYWLNAPENGYLGTGYPEDPGVIQLGKIGSNSGHSADPEVKKLGAIGSANAQPFIPNVQPTSGAIGFSNTQHFFPTDSAGGEEYREYMAKQQALAVQQQILQQKAENEAKLQIEKAQAQQQALAMQQQILQQKAENEAKLQIEKAQMMQKLAEKEAEVAQLRLKAMISSSEQEGKSKEGKGKGFGKGKGVQSSTGAQSSSASEPFSSHVFVGIIQSSASEDSIASIECREASCVYESGNVIIDGPFGMKVGDTVCFTMMHGNREIGKPRVRGDSLMPLTNQDCFVGTIKAYSQRNSGEKVGWITCLGSQKLHRADVYVHGSMLEEDSTVGDIVRFQVHLNQKDQPQAAMGSVSRLKKGEGHCKLTEAEIACGGKSSMQGVTMNTINSAPGRVIKMTTHSSPVPAEDTSTCNDARGGPGTLDPQGLLPTFAVGPEATLVSEPGPASQECGVWLNDDEVQEMLRMATNSLLIDSDDDDNDDGGNDEEAVYDQEPLSRQ